jgi:hypothetical protein
MDPALVVIAIQSCVCLALLAALIRAWSREADLQHKLADALRNDHRDPKTGRFTKP